MKTETGTPPTAATAGVRPQWHLWALAFSLALMLPACGGDSPTSPSSRIPSVAGTYTGPLNFTADGVQIATPAPHDFFGQPSASRRMSYVPGKTARGWGLGGSPEGDRRGLSLVGARRHGAVVGAAESIRRHRVAQGGVARGPQSTPRGDGRDTLAVAWRVPRGRGGPLETSRDAHRG